MIGHQRRTRPSTWILDPSAALDSPDVGGKARSLARATREGLPVPPWFVLRAVDSVSMDAGIRAALEAAVARLSPNGETLAVRSSAGDEDGDAHSFAGQLDSFLDVAPRDVADRVVAVWRSAFSVRVRAYRRQRGLGEKPQPPAVIVQRMVEPRAAGVAFSADPVSGRRGVAIVSAVRGRGDALVSGAADAETWAVDREDAIVERPAGSAVLTDDNVRAVASLARTAARIFGCPQDVEWAFGERLELLQSRPITSLHHLPDPDGCLTIWDNSNIVESYSGVSAPLTFSFAREVYPPVYRQFCRMMGVPASVVARHDDAFVNVLGLLRGRLYYNLLNWYRILALLPGYRLNRRFMEQMMGVGEPLPADLAGEIAAQAKSSRLLDAWRVARTLAGLLANHLIVDRRVAAFQRRLDDALAPPAPPLETRRPDELTAYYRDLRQRLLLRWDAPLVNDFFAMVFYGLLRQLAIRWCGDPGGTLQNDLLAGDGGVVSAEPAILIQRLARLATADPSVVECLSDGSAEAIAAAFAGHALLRDGCRAYLDKFGDRTINELKLESLTLHDDPMPFFRAIGTLARQMPVGQEIASCRFATTAGDNRRAESRARVARAFARHPLRRAVFAWTLSHARRRVRDRENLRLERTRLFARVRQVFLELGRRLHAMRVLDDPRDVLYLEVEEVLAFVDGRSTCTNLRALARLRQQEFAEYETGAAPVPRFETRGIPWGQTGVRPGSDRGQTGVRPGSDRGQTGVRPGSDRGQTTEPGSPLAPGSRRGTGCSPGIVRGPVRIVTDPHNARLDGRSILVAEQTDPGWVLLFPSALGILVARGSLLSHAAIVARELGIPAIVSLGGVTDWLRDGDWIEMDGATGVVGRVEPGLGVRGSAPGPVEPGHYKPCTANPEPRASNQELQTNA